MTTKMTLEPPNSPHAAVPATPGASQGTDTVLTDTLGRRLKVKEPDILQESRIVKIMGESASNAAYMTGYVMPAVMVVEIDGERLPFPATEREVEAAIKLVGREGMQAIMENVVASAQSAEARRAELKNS